MIDSVILRTAARLLLSLMVLFSIFILWRGHNEPGGGFIGGLIAATAFALHAISAGAADLRKLLPVDPLGLAAAGLGTALTAGLLAAGAGEPFLTGLWTFIGATATDKGLPLGTPLLFDIGVYLVVVGGVLHLLLGIEEEIEDRGEG